MSQSKRGKKIRIPLDTEEKHFTSLYDKLHAFPNVTTESAKALVHRYTQGREEEMKRMNAGILAGAIYYIAKNPNGTGDDIDFSANPYNTLLIPVKASKSLSGKSEVDPNKVKADIMRYVWYLNHP